MSESNLVDDPIELLLHSFFTTINLSGIVKKVSRRINVREARIEHQRVETHTIGLSIREEHKSTE